MAYQQYVTKFKTFLTQWASAVSGDGSSVTFDHTIDTRQELNNLRNATTINDVVQLSNAYYDQVSIGRTMNELYKKPKDYFADFVAATALMQTQLDNLNNEVTLSTANVKVSGDQNKSIKALASKLQLKLSLIKSDYDS